MPAAFDMKLSFYDETAAAQFIHLQPPITTKDVKIMGYTAANDK